MSDKRIETQNARIIELCRARSGLLIATKLAARCLLRQNAEGALQILNKALERYDLSEAEKVQNMADAIADLMAESAEDQSHE